MLRKITKILLLVTAIVWIAYDIVPFLNPERGDTISEVICYYGSRYSTLPLVFGVLMGHFFCPVKEGAKQYPLALISIAVLAIIRDTLFSYPVDVSPILWLLLGIPLGAILWQQNRS